MNLRNRVQLIGNLGSDPKVFEFENGKKVSFSLATNEFYTKDGKTVQNTTWHNLVAWNKTAELIGNNLKKGSEIVINGKLVNRSYDDKDGNKRYITEVVVNEVVFRSQKEAA